jgi:glycolate oxidase
MGMGSLPIAEITQIVGASNVITSLEDRHCYSYDASKLKAIPDCVVFPGNAAEVAELLKLANREGFPVFPRGAGSGMVGASVPWTGGLVLALNRLNRILEIDPDNMVAVVEPSVVTARLQEAVARYALFYPPDPASLQFSTLGGNVAMGAGGPRAVKYGVTRDYVLGLEVVLPTGAIMQTGSRTMKGVVGYDLTRLMVGSEGTLGIFTRIILRLIPQPEAWRTLLAAFHHLDSAAQAVSTIIKNRVLPSTLELMDQATIQAVDNYQSLGLPAGIEAILLIEVDGKECTVDIDLAKVREICQGEGASLIEVARSAADRERLWRARRSISPALAQIKPGKINEDVTVPRTQIPALIRAIRQLAAKYRLIIISFGHAGDGNIHTNIMLDRSDCDELKRAERAVEELFRVVLQLGGTLSGEHGIGITKSPFFQWEVGPAGWEAMWQIKRALDPLNVLNPGKMFVPNRAFFN